MASLLYSFKLICSVLGTVDKCGNHNFCVVLYGDASGSEMTHFTINQSFPSSCVSSCYRKACRQRWTSSYPHTWSVTSYWGLWWSFAGISFSFSQGNSRRVCSFVCECVCLWNSGWLAALHTVTHTDSFPTAPQSCRALRDPQTRLTHTCLTLQLASSPFAANVCMG